MQTGATPSTPITIASKQVLPAKMAHGEQRRVNNERMCYCVYCGKWRTPKTFNETHLKNCTNFAKKPSVKALREPCGLNDHRRSACNSGSIYCTRCLKTWKIEALKVSTMPEWASCKNSNHNGATVRSYKLDEKGEPVVEMNDKGQAYHVLITYLYCRNCIYITVLGEKKRMLPKPKKDKKKKRSGDIDDEAEEATPEEDVAELAGGNNQAKEEDDGEGSEPVSDAEESDSDSSSDGSSSDEEEEAKPTRKRPREEDPLDLPLRDDDVAFEHVEAERELNSKVKEETPAA
jgi:hypothetical protein